MTTVLVSFWEIVPEVWRERYTRVAQDRKKQASIFVTSPERNEYSDMPLEVLNCFNAGMRVVAGLALDNGDGGSGGQ